MFSPTFIDWLAHETPPDFAFRLSSGSFVCEAPQWRGQHRVNGGVDVEHLDLLAGSGGSHIELPLPAAATDVFRGALQPGGRPAYLAWLEYENEIDGIRYYVAVIGELTAAVPDTWFDEVEVLATAAAPGLPEAAVGVARDHDFGISTGGGSAVVYVTSTGWGGRPSGQRVDELLATSQSVFEALERDQPEPGTTQSR